MYASRGKNALLKNYSAKAILILDAELELTKLKIKHPEQFTKETLSTPPSVLSVIPKFPNLGIMGMTEILSSLMLLGGIVNKEGKQPSIIAYAEVFEHAFGFSFNNIYDCQSLLFKRKPYNLTKTLDAMKTALLKEYKKRKIIAEKNKDEKRQS